jgi:2-oxoisovalerate dehydrogenase E1 component
LNSVTDYRSLLSRSKQVNRAECVDQNLVAVLEALRAVNVARLSDPTRAFAESSLTARDVRELIESQLISRHLDLMARVLRVQNKVFYTIGSSGHEGNAMVARAARHTDPAFLHYRSGGFMAERSRKLPGIDPIWDSALSFAASADDPASGGRHKVWGSKPLWVLPQTSTIASHLPKALGTALAIEQADRVGHRLPIPRDSIAICTFGDASANHSTAQGAFNAAQWAAHQGLPAPVLFVCEDNGIGISVRTPSNWIAKSFANRHALAYFYADGLDLVAGFDAVNRAVAHCRSTRQPTFLHLKTVRLMGHAGTDFEVEYRALDDVLDGEAADPILVSVIRAVHAGVYGADELLALNQSIRERCLDAAHRADERPRLTTLQAITAPLAPYSPAAVKAEAERVASPEQRLNAFGSDAQLPENAAPKHLAIQINQALIDTLIKYPHALVFGEDVAQKGGVYTVSKGLHKLFKGARVFNTLLDEQTILGMAQGYANVGLLPIPEIQYLAYFHNACDQIRGEAASLQFFSNNQFQNPMVVRIAGLGYQKGFGGHFHNDNSFAALRDIPGLIVGCPSRGDDAVEMLRTLTALAVVDGRVSVFLEPIALYMTKDLHEPGDGGWLTRYPPPNEALGSARRYGPADAKRLVISYGNGVPMSLRAIRQFEAAGGEPTALLDLRWLQPLAVEVIRAQATSAKRILVVDEGRFSASVGEGVITALVEGGQGGKRIDRVVGADTFTPLGAAAGLVLPSDAEVLAALQAP